MKHIWGLDYLFKGTRWCSWLRHCTTSWKVVGLIPDDVTGIFHWHNPSNRNEHQEYFLGGKDGQCIGLMTLPPSCADWNLWASTSWNRQGLSRTVMVLLYLFTICSTPSRNYKSLVTEGRVYSWWHGALKWRQLM